MFYVDSYATKHRTYIIYAFLFFLFSSICGHCCTCYQPENSMTGLT